MSTVQDTANHSPVKVNGVGTVSVPVGDQDRAVEFYVDALGIEFQHRVATARSWWHLWVCLGPSWL